MRHRHKQETATTRQQGPPPRLGPGMTCVHRAYAQLSLEDIHRANEPRIEFALLMDDHALHVSRTHDGEWTTDSSQACILLLSEDF